MGRFFPLLLTLVVVDAGVGPASARAGGRLPQQSAIRRRGRSTTTLPVVTDVTKFRLAEIIL
jgi:hypothetical protein